MRIKKATGWIILYKAIHSEVIQKAETKYSIGQLHRDGLWQRMKSSISVRPVLPGPPLVFERISGDDACRLWFVIIWCETRQKQTQNPWSTDSRSAHQGTCDLIDARGNATQYCMYHWDFSFSLFASLYDLSLFSVQLYKLQIGSGLSTLLLQTPSENWQSNPWGDRLVVGSWHSCRR